MGFSRKSSGSLGRVRRNGGLEPGIGFLSTSVQFNRLLVALGEPLAEEPNDRMR
jgi:hypothetical protein